jgi:ATP-dependent DNA helicase pcrA
VTGLEEGLFPGSQARFFPREMEEERRLFYVAVTRAKRFCFLSYAQSRFRYGQFELSDPSPFIAEISQRFVQEETLSFGSEDHIPNALREALFGNEWDEPTRTPDFSAKTSTSRAYPKPTIRKDNSISSKNGSSTSTTLGFSSSSAPSTQSSALKPMKAAQSKSASAATNAAISALAEGSHIEHDRFGKGTILSIEGTGENTKAEVEFQAVGRKKLLLKFARFKVLD